MTKEKIIDDLLNNGKISDNQLKFDLFTGDIANVADTLLAEFEQEKKEMAKDILSKMQYSLENPKASKDFAIYTFGLIAKEYGVEL